MYYDRITPICKRWVSVINYIEEYPLKSSFSLVFKVEKGRNSNESPLL